MKIGIMYKCRNCGCRTQVIVEDNYDSIRLEEYQDTITHRCRSGYVGLADLIGTDYIKRSN